MRFQLSEELELIRSVVKDFAENDIAAHADSRDEHARFDQELFAKLAALGLAGIPIPEVYGGAGSDFLTYSVVLEELAKVCASTSAMLTAHTAYCVYPLFRFGHEAAKREALFKLASGNKLGGCALHRAGKVDKGNEITTGHAGDVCMLQGSQHTAINAGAADYYAVTVRDAAAKTRNGCSLFLVSSEVPQLKIGEPEQKLGLRSLPTAAIGLEHYRSSSSWRLGKAGQGHEVIKAILDIGHISAAAQSVGIAQGALDAATGYAKKRTQFGKSIGRQQGVSFKLADMAAQIEAARLLLYQAAWRLDTGESCSREAAIARKFAAQAAVNAAIEAVQIFGGCGYMREYRMERYLRDAKVVESDYGTCGIKADTIFRILAE